MITCAHKEKLLAALQNRKVQEDWPLLHEAFEAYQQWIIDMNSLTSIGSQKIIDMTRLLNQYKDFVEVELISARGSSALKRQKGQLKLDNSILEEFLPYLVDTQILNNLPTEFELETGSHTSFMSLAFRPSNIRTLNKPEIVIKSKDQDFAIGKSVYYKFSSDEHFSDPVTIDGKFFLAVLAAECKVNYDKTMFQECAGTAARLKQGCPVSKYYTLVEYLDMQPEDTRLTQIDNVFLLRKAKRLPFEKRNVYEEVRDQHQAYPISADVILHFVNEIQNFVDATWYNPDEALARGSFV